ncbi:MAG: hypothetical protein ACE3JK_09175 [Sporolactobacillus sp.]
MNHNQYPFYFIAIIAFFIYRRFRRNIGWQPFKSSRMAVRIALCTIISLIFIYASLRQPIGLISDGLGILAGVILAFYGARYTELKNEGMTDFYKPNVWIGSLVGLLFVFRFVFRLQFIFQSNLPSNKNPDATFNSLSSNSWSAGLLLILFAYYVFYYSLLLSKHQRSAVDQ